VVYSAFNRGIEIAGADRLVIENRVGLMQTMPIAYGDQVQAIPGVKYVTHDHWFGGVYQDEKNFFPQFVIDPENHLKVYPEFAVPDDQWKNFVNDREGAIAGAKTAQRFGWKVGDRIPIKNALYGSGKTWEFNLDGIYHAKTADGDESQFWLQWKRFDESLPATLTGLKSSAGWYIIRLDNPDDAARVAKTIDGKFANSSWETKTETESAFQAGFAKQFGNIEFLILSIGTVVFFTLLLVTGNTMAIAVRERTAELAVLKAIGVRDGSILFLVLTESMFIAFIGGVLGLLLAVLMIPAMSGKLQGFLPPLILSAPLLTFGLFFAIFVGVMSGLIPGIGAMRMRVVNALRRA
jgi:putative ABC transport system permease protein